LHDPVPQAWGLHIVLQALQEYQVDSQTAADVAVAAVTALPCSHAVQSVGMAILEVAEVRLDGPWCDDTTRAALRAALACLTTPGPPPDLTTWVAALRVVRRGLRDTSWQDFTAVRDAVQAVTCVSPELAALGLTILTDSLHAKVALPHAMLLQWATMVTVTLTKWPLHDGFVGPAWALLEELSKTPEVPASQEYVAALQTAVAHFGGSLTDPDAVNDNGASLVHFRLVQCAASVARTARWTAPHQGRASDTAIESIMQAASVALATAFEYAARALTTETACYRSVHVVTLLWAGILLATARCEVVVPSVGPNFSLWIVTQALRVAGPWVASSKYFADVWFACVLQLIDLVRGAATAAMDQAGVAMWQRALWDHVGPWHADLVAGRLPCRTDPMLHMVAYELLDEYAKAAKTPPPEGPRDAAATTALQTWAWTHAVAPAWAAAAARGAVRQQYLPARRLFKWLTGAKPLWGPGGALTAANVQPADVFRAALPLGGFTDAHVLQQLLVEHVLPACPWHHVSQLQRDVAVLVQEGCLPAEAAHLRWAAEVLWATESAYCRRWDGPRHGWAVAGT
jgi:hypothetical protein